MFIVLSLDPFYSSPVNSSGSDSRGSSIHHNTNGNNIEYRDRIPISSPPMDDMAPQSISFIGDEDSVDLITEHPRKNPFHFFFMKKYCFLSTHNIAINL